MPTFITSLLTNAKLWLVVLAIVALAGVGFYVYHLKNEVTTAQTAVASAQVNEAKMNDTINGLTAQQAQAQQVIQQVTSDKQQAIAAVSALSDSLNHSAQQISTLKQQLNNVKATPTPISPYLSQAIQGVMDQQVSRAASAPIGASQ